MSSKVVTVALFLVARTEARQDGQVKGFDPLMGGLGEFRLVFSWKENHSFKQAPQKVCRQSSRVRGW